MKTLLTLTALTLTLTAVSPAASINNAGFTQLSRSGVSVLMPCDPGRETFNKDGIFRTDYSCGSNAVNYRVSVADYTNEAYADYSAIVSNVLRSMNAARVVQNEAMTFNGNQGRFVRFETADNLLIFYWIHNRGTRRYQMIAIAAPGAGFGSDAKTMFESFRVTE